MARFKEKELSLMRIDERNRYLKDLTETKEHVSTLDTALSVNVPFIVETTISRETHFSK